MTAISIKLVVVGDGAVGKTSLITSFATNQFPVDYVPSVFTCWMSNEMEIDGQRCHLIPWDTAGMNQCRNNGSVITIDLLLQDSLIMIDSGHYPILIVM